MCFERCTYYMIHKKRVCRMLVKKGSQYCGQHLVHSNEFCEMGKKRIPCPLDPKHSCFEHVLEQHLKCCNASKSPNFPCYSFNLNSGCGQEKNRTSLSKITDTKLLETIEKVIHVHKNFIGNIKRKVRHHSIFEDELNSSQCGSLAKRHLKQNASLLGNLNEEGLLNTRNKITYIEFGAGKGQLTKWIINCTENLENATFILVDRGSQRYKCDAKLKYNEEVDISRLKLDIQHLDLNKVEDLKNDRLYFVAHGKHLCGAATDFALNCIGNFDMKRCAGILIALCCHHRCSWKSYTGKQFFEKANISIEEFGIFLSITGWGICTAKEAEEGSHIFTGDKNSSTIESENPTGAFGNRYKKLNLSVNYREEIGKKAKQILDYGRLEFLREKGLRADLIEYVDRSDTLENIAILAVPS